MCSRLTLRPMHHTLTGDRKVFVQSKKTRRFKSVVESHLVSFRTGP
jgi:hypothetical protein